jgi:competence ComEA-like helix-hairpin-helix protein
MDLDQIVRDRIAKEAGVSSKQVEATIRLVEDQATVPFIARYRKEVTGNLDEVQIRTISERHVYYKDLLERRATILRSIEEQGKLSEELKNCILACYEKAELEDLYLPYKPKRKTKASVAIEKGLQPLAHFLYQQAPVEKSIEDLADTFVNVDKQVTTREEALEGALHIVAEWVSEDPEIRKTLREIFLREGIVVSKVNPDKAGQKTKYDMYYDFREPVSKIPSHRLLAIRRGVKEQVLNFAIELDAEKSLRLISGRVIKDSQSPFAAYLEAGIKDSYERLLNPSLQSEVRAWLKERSDAEAINVFEANLANLLLSPPAGLIGVMGIDPGFRTGCKVAVVDETGKFLEQTTIYPVEPKKDIVGSERRMYRLVQKHNVRAIAIGNGTGSRETDAFVRDFIRKYQKGEPLGVAPVEVKNAQDIPLPLSDSQPPEAMSVTQATSDAEVAPALRTAAGTEPVASIAGGAEATPVSEANVIAEAETMPEASAGLEGAPVKPPSEAWMTVALQAPHEGLDTAAATDSRVAHSEMAPAPPEADRSVRGSLTEAAPPREPTLLAQSGLPAKSVDLPVERHPIFSVIVNEAGASVYSASESARQEFPKLDVTARGAISIARRLQDPLAELVKIHPKSIGVGQYQHDVDQKRLKQGLEGTVESCVNRVGIDVNTASYELLRYCSGVNQKLARSIVEHRNQRGRFSNRMQLLQVSGFGEKTFEQAAGFLRIKNGEMPLDSTAVHPESYALVEKMAQSLAVPVSGLIENSLLVETLELEKFADERAGLYTLNDIKQELLKPGRDPRDTFVVPTFRDDVKEVSDLKVDMVLEGAVTNVTNFGAFVDIGVHQDGLVHVSELSNRFIQDPREAVRVGEIVRVKVIGVDVPMKRISLSIKALLPSRKRSRPEKKPPAAKPAKAVPKQADAVAAAGPAPAKQPGASKDRRHHGGPQQSAKPRRVQPRPGAKAEEKPPAKPAPMPAPPKKVEPAPPPLSLEEKIRLLQQKFGGIR